MSRRNATFWSKVGETGVGEMGVGEMGVGEQGPIHLQFSTAVSPQLEHFEFSYKWTNWLERKVICYQLEFGTAN